MELSRNTYLEVKSKVIKENIEKIINKNPKYKYYFGVVKANCYGIEDEEFNVTKNIIKAGCNYLAVATLEEGIEIRRKIKEIPILVLGHIPEKYVKEAIKNNITVTVHSLEYLKEILKESDIKNIRIHLKVDTGMNRLGIKDKEELEKTYNLCKEKGLNVEGIFTHIYNASSKKDYEKQIEKFKEITSKIPLNEIPIVHIPASEALINYPKLEFVNGARLGIIMYGLTDKKELDLKSPIKLISEVVQIHNLEKGETVGYNAKFVADKKTRIAVVPIGYADGIIRKNSGRSVYINDKKYKIVGNICMDMLFLEVDENVKEYDKVEIIKDNNHIEQIANYLDTIPYEVLTNIGNRVIRKVI